MSIERFIRCPCGHGIEQHDANGCVAAESSAHGERRCPCPQTRLGVLDRLFDAERDSIRHAWRG